MLHAPASVAQPPEIPGRPIAPSALTLEALRATWQPFDKSRRAAQRHIETERITRRTA